MAARKRKRKEQAPGWVWMLFGLSIGLAVALGVYLTGGGSLLSDRQPQMSVEESPAPPAAKTPAEPQDQPSVEQSGAEESDLEFYELLEKLEVAIPDSRPESRSDGESVQLESAYTIQAGAFLTFAEADSRKARLALLGIDSNIEQAIVNNDIWHRVIIGPLSERAEINDVLRRLRNERIDTLAPKPVSN